MQTVKVNAKEIMQSENPVQNLAGLFGYEHSSLEQLVRQLEKDQVYRLVEVSGWPVKEDLWTSIADGLENIQQHSEYFFLVWGSEKISGPETQTS